MIKFKMFFDKDKETKWLNEMAMEGLNATGFFAGIWTFEKCEPGEYLYQTDFGSTFGSVSDEYKELLKESDIEIVQLWGFWIILRRKASLGEFELYTDIDSQIEHYTKILKMFKCVTIFEFICLLIQVYVAADRTANWGIVFIFMAIVIGFVNITLRTRKRIDDLKEKQTGIENPQRRNVSLLLSVGLLFNSCALLAQDSISDPLRNIIQVVAIIFMLLGITETCRKKK